MKIQNNNSVEVRNSKYQEYQKKIIEKFGLAVTTAEIRIAFPELVAEFDDEALDNLIDNAIVEAVNTMIKKSEVALRNTISKGRINENGIPSGFCVIRHKDMLNMQDKKIFDQYEGVVLKIVKVNDPYIFFDDGTFLAEDFKNDKDRYLFKEREIADA